MQEIAGNDTDVKLPAGRHGWTYLSNHAHVLVALAKNPEARVRDVADDVGITERAVLQILHDLEESGAIARHRQGRRTHYEIDRAAALRHPLEAHRRIDDILRLADDR
jgi:predicted ArsR family transcriptional regulator